MDKGKNILEVEVDGGDFTDFDDVPIDINVIHGGHFKSEKFYVGGKSHIIECVKWQLFQYMNLSELIKSLGYNSILISAFGGLGDVNSYTFFEDGDSFDDLISNHVDVERRSLIIFVQCLDYDMTDGDAVGVGKGKGKSRYKGKDKSKELVEKRVNLMNICFDEEEGDMNLVSEYELSDDSVYSLDSDEEDIGYRRSKKRSTTIVYKNIEDEQSLVFELGMQFCDYAECKEAIRDWAIKYGYNIKWIKSDEKKIVARCDGDCPWRLYASRLGHESTFSIKTMVDKHTCLRKSHNRQATADWLASKLIPILRRRSNYPVKEMIQDILEKYSIIVKEDLCYSAKAKALKQLSGSFESHYKMLKSYIAHLIQMDEEGTFLLQTSLNNDGIPVFERAYIGFSALRKGFLRGCRRCICFDACFLKTVLGGALLAAVAKDCNNKMWPIAWAVVEKESEDSWTWFFGHLFKDLNIVDGLGWTFMSDKHRGIINGILKLTPQAEHRHCARHIYANWKKQFSGPKLKKLFWNAVKCTSQTEFRYRLSLLKEESDDGHQHFIDQEPRRFCKSCISTFPKTDIVDNNICESFNSYITKSRDKPIIDMLEEIRLSLMCRQPVIVKMLENSSGILCPNVNKQIEKLQKMIRYCVVKPALNKKFEVHAFDEVIIVDLVNKECSCRAWELTGIPCYHAIACISHDRDDTNMYVDEFYTRRNCLEAHKYCLTPIHGPKSWPEVVGPSILPPIYVRPPGRPKKNRRRDASEEPRIGKTWRVQCSICKMIGHNSRTCKNPPLERESSTEPTRPLKSGRPPRTNNHIQRKEMRQARKGYGVFTGESGDIYFRGPGMNHTKFIRRKEYVDGSQSSQVIDRNTTHL